MGDGVTRLDLLILPTTQSTLDDYHRILNPEGGVSLTLETQVGVSTGTMEDPLRKVVRVIPCPTYL